jgi:hypothetical protein
MWRRAPPPARPDEGVRAYVVVVSPEQRSLSGYNDISG